jgi:hypothetical protein
MPRLVLALVLVLAAAPARADGHLDRFAIELSPLSLDWFFGGEYVADESVSSTAIGVAYERRLGRHLAAGAVVTYVQPGSVALPFLPGLETKHGDFSIDELRTSSRMVAAQGRLRLVFPFAGDAAEIGLALQAGPSFLWFPVGYWGWGAAAEASLDAVWFWSRWGAALRASGSLALTDGTTHFTANVGKASIARIAAPTLTAALLRSF